MTTYLIYSFKYHTSDCTGSDWYDVKSSLASLNVQNKRIIVSILEQVKIPPIINMSFLINFSLRREKV